MSLADPTDGRRTAPPARRPLTQRLVFAIPVLGWMLRDAAEGGESELMWFAATIVGLLICATILFGLKGLVMGMLVMAGLTLTAVLLITRG